MTARSLRLLSLLATLSIALGCDAPSEIVIVVDAEPGLVLDALTIEARSTGSPQTAELDLREASAPPAPWTLGLSAPGGTALVARVIGTTRAGGTVEARARTTFVAGERRILHVHLASACVDVDCDEGTSCDPAGRGCVDEARETCPYREPLPTGLPQSCGAPVDGGGVDASVSDGGTDGGRTDAGTDGGVTDGGSPLPRPTLCASGTCQVAAGARHACALDASGLVRCWGSNDDGELGQDGPARGRAALIAGIHAHYVAAGAHFTCAITALEEVRCWGRNDASQLGAPSSTLPRSSTPRVVAFPTGASPVALSAGERFACALLADRTVACWGDNRAEQLDREDLAEAPEPQAIDLDFLAEGIDAGAEHACAWGEGRSRCWGALPIDATATLTGVVAVSAAASHTCAIVETDGEPDVRCWGDNYWAQSGEGAGAVVPPASVGTRAVEITAGLDHTCARLEDGTRRCWGYNEGGALAVQSVETFVRAPSPGEGPVTTWLQLAAGDRFTCGIDDAHAVHCWGWDLAGAVGRDAVLHGGVTPVVMGSGAIGALATGGAHACADIDGVTRCWGANDVGQLGIDLAPPAAASPRDVIVTDPWTATAIAAGRAHTCAIDTSSALRCWGSNAWDQLARSGSLAARPGLPLESITSVVGITTGAEHTCAHVGAGGTPGPGLYCWGRGDEGQLGGSPADRSPPMLAFDSVHGASAGGAHTCAIDDAAMAVWCWGRSDEGQTGGAPSTPPDAGFSTAVEVAAGGDFTCARVGLNDIRCVGAGARGQLGNGGTAMSDSPVAVGTLSGMAGVTAGAAHACAWTASDVYCWGANERGQANGTPGEDLLEPMMLEVGSGAIERVEAGDAHTCAVLHEGGNDRVVCWGSDEDGRLGRGRALVVSVPSRVMEEE